MRKNLCLQSGFLYDTMGHSVVIASLKSGHRTRFFYALIAVFLVLEVRHGIISYSI